MEIIGGIYELPNPGFKGTELQKFIWKLFLSLETDKKSSFPICGRKSLEIS
jgi:hypothetical protein